MEGMTNTETLAYVSLPFALFTFHWHSSFTYTCIYTHTNPDKIYQTVLLWYALTLSLLWIEYFHKLVNHVNLKLATNMPSI